MSELSALEWALLPLKKYSVFTGRAPRAEYWWFYLGTVIVGIPLAIIDKVLGNAGVLGLLLNLALLLPWLSVSVRRLHDTDRTGWWLVALAGAFVLIALVVAFESMGESASVSSAGSLTAIIVAVVALLAAAVTFLVFMVLPGTEGPNRYGPDPYGPGGLEEVFA